MGVSHFMFLFFSPVAAFLALARPTCTPSPSHRPASPLPMPPSLPIAVSFFALSFFVFLPSVSAAAGADPIVFPDPSPEGFRALSVLISLFGTLPSPILCFSDSSQAFLYYPFVPQGG